jgi:simple sugar transport system ATP-binding protein
VTDRPIVEALAIRKRFGTTIALDDVSLAIRPGESRALVGRNGAGKSTLVSILTGLQPAEAGEVRFDGSPAPSLADREGWRRRIACVYQRSTVIPTLSVVENLYLNRQSGRGAISWPRLRRDGRQLLAEWGLDVDPSRPAADLTVDQRQMLEIARALSLGARIIILDEPTAQLDAAAIQRLFERIRSLQAQGVTFLYISHHLQEIYEVCETVTVLRDARHVVTDTLSNLQQDALVEAMTGDAIGLIDVGRDRAGVDAGAPAVLEARELTLPGHYSQVSFTVRAGEVVGLAGGGASGTVELGETLSGLRRAASGTVAIGGRPVAPGNPRAALDAGLGFVPEDRHKEGLVPLLSVAENMTMPIAHELGRFGWISPAHRAEVTQRFMAELDIKAAGPSQAVSGLSGGNQQKVVTARGLANRPRALVLVTPTAGVDVRAKQSLLGAVDAVARDGTGVLIVSDDVDELRPCDRVLVMFRGMVVDEKPRGWSDRGMVAAMEGVDSGEPRE